MFFGTALVFFCIQFGYCVKITIFDLGMIKIILTFVCADCIIKTQDREVIENISE